jgi:hypothetical protein
MTKEEFKVVAARIFNMGQNYWMYGDSEFYSHHKKADAVYEAYKNLVQETVDSLENETP